MLASSEWMLAGAAGPLARRAASGLCVAGLQQLRGVALGRSVHSPAARPVVAPGASAPWPAAVGEPALPPGEGPPVLQRVLEELAQAHSAERQQVRSLLLRRATSGRGAATVHDGGPLWIACRRRVPAAPWLRRRAWLPPIMSRTAPCAWTRRSSLTAAGGVTWTSTAW